MKHTDLYRSDFEAVSDANNAEGHLWSAERILDGWLDNDGEVTLEALDDLRNHVREAAAYFAQYNADEDVLELRALLGY